MSFYHTNLNIRLGDIVDICNIQNSDFDLNTLLNTFIRPDIAANNDLTFVSNLKYNSKTSAICIITNKNLYKNFSNDKITLISNNLDCDIVNLHWIGNNLIPIKKISKIRKPIVWTLHDMWAYTGSEHYSQNERFVTGYNKTNRPEDLKGLDVEKYCWNLKRKYYPQKMTIVPTSKWQLENLKKSYLLKNHQIQKIPLPIDFNFWKRFDKKLSRKLLNLPQDKKIILIGSENLSHKRKGSNYLNQIFNDFCRINI